MEAGMEIRDWLLIISMLGHFSYTLYAYIERRGDKTNERIAALAAKVEQLDKDVGALAITVKSAPSHDNLGEVYESINKLAAMVHQLVGENRSQTDTLRLIQNQIMQKGMRND